MAWSEKSMIKHKEKTIVGWGVIIIALGFLFAIYFKIGCSGCG